MIHTVRAGDTVQVVGPDGVASDPFVLAETISISTSEVGDGSVWIYRQHDAPLVLPRLYALDSRFLLHHRPDPQPHC